MGQNTEDHGKRMILKRYNRRNNRVFNGYDGGGVYHDYNHYTYYTPYEEIRRKQIEMQRHHWLKEKRRRITNTTVAPTTELTQQHTTPRNMTHDWFTIHLYTERVTWPPRTLVNRAVLQPPTTPSSSSNSSSASFLYAMLIPVLIAIPVLLIALCFMVIMLFRANRLRQQSNTRCGLQRRNAYRERREPDEWSNMIATNRTPPLRQQDYDAIFLDHLEDIGALRQLSHNDKPPPYSECTRSSETTSKKHVSEEPPPPYSACYVANTHFKNAEPKVHIRRQNVLNERAHSSTDIDNAQNELIENGFRREDVNMTTSSNDTTPEMRTELIFANGRIVERASLVLNSTNNEAVGASNDMVEKQSTRQGDFNDKVVYTDETTPKNTTPDKE